MKLLGLFLLIIIFVPKARSQTGPIQIKVTDYGWINNFPALKPFVDDYLETVEADLNEQQPVRDPNRIVQSTANSTAISSRGIGRDYASKIKNYEIGAAIGAAADLEEAGITDVEVSGIGGAAGIMFGKRINEKIVAFFNIGGLSHSQTFQGILGTDLNADITTFNVGLHGQYSLAQSEHFGLTLHLGYEFNKNDLVIEDTLNEDINIDVGGVATLQGRLKGTPEYLIHTETHSIPLELAGNVTFLKLFTLYGGGGADLNYGYSHGTGKIKAMAFSPLACVSGACTNLSLPEVEAYANINNRKRVDDVIFRSFGGLQLNFWNFKIYAEGEKMINSKIYGVTVGLRAVF